MVLENKTMANITQCILASADKTNLSRFFSEAEWSDASVHSAVSLQAGSGGGPNLLLLFKNVRISSLGKVRLVISFANPDLTGTCAVLVTNYLSWSAQKIIETYLLRWPIETFYQSLP